jgi:Fic family protein
MQGENNYNQLVRLWKSFDIRTAAELQQHLDSFKILFAYHSGKIENDEIDYNDTREIFSNNRISSFTGNPRTIFEQQNQKTCYEFLIPKIVAKEPLNVALVKEIHAALTAGTFDERRYVENGERPGEFKKHDYVTGIHEVGSPPSAVEQDVSDLLEEMAAIQNSDNISFEKLLKAAAYFHARFEFIHPFADGNGRIGRTLVNYFLLINNHPPLILFEEDRKQYFNSLRSYDENEDIRPLYNFFIAELEKTWAKKLERESGSVAKKKKNLQDLI